MSKQPEVWLRGALPRYPALLQPVVHAILQAQEELHDLIAEFPDRLLWERPAGLASPAFHLQHLTGVLARLATYARGEALSAAQLDDLKREGVVDASLTTEQLVNRFDSQVDRFLQQVAATDENNLSDFRGVGRALLPSTVGGLLFHAAEHTQRHYGQLLVTVKMLKHQ